jgi:diphthamide synthase (EF-2-diphthine--ammonia ligase)
MDVEDDQQAEEGLESREPSAEDLVELCRRLNEEGAKYLVVGGFAIRSAGYLRATMDIDLVIDVSPENEAKVFEAMRSLPDRAVDGLDAGDVERFTVVRIADEIVVDLMQSASGIDYEEASKSMVVREVDGVAIPFASERLLWRMKRTTHREKDRADLVFLRQGFIERGEEVPD